MSDKEIPISDAKALANIHDKRAVIVMWIGEHSYGYTSYGKTKAECAAAKRLGDVAFDAVHEAMSNEMQWGAVGE